MPEAQADDILNQSTFNELKQLMDRDFEHLLEVFYASVVDSLEAIKVAVSQQDFDGLREHAHSLKGSSGNFGAERLARLCKNMELAASQGNVTVIEGSLLELEQNTIAVVNRVKDASRRSGL